MDNWIVTVVQIKTPANDCHNKNVASCVRLDVHPFCSQITMIHTVVAANPAYVGLLAKKKQGDGLVVSGVFLKKWWDSWVLPVTAEWPIPTSANDFEGSLTESGAMEQPEYNAHITLLK